MTELLDRRILGAVRFVDATTRQKIQDPLDVRADGVRFVRNRASLYVIASAVGLEKHVDAFDQPPAAPAVGSVKTPAQVSDPAGRFLGRTFTLELPRDPTLDPADGASLFHPLDVALFPSSTADVSPGWALIRASVTKAGGAAAPGALVRVLAHTGGAVMAMGLADGRGEALVAVPGIPVTTFGAEPGDPVTTSEVSVGLETIYDAAAGAWPDPDSIVQRKALLPTSTAADVKLASGRVVTTSLVVPAP